MCGCTAPCDINKTCRTPQHGRTVNARYEGHVARTRAMRLPHTDLASLVRAASRADVSLDASGILWLEHINMEVGDREQALHYFRDFLGFVEDPSPSFHLNLGSQQLHLAVAQEAHVITGSVGLAVPSLDALRARASEAASALRGTRFHLAVRRASHPSATSMS